MESESKNKFLHVKEGDLGELVPGVVKGKKKSSDEIIEDFLTPEPLQKPTYAKSNTREKTVWQSFKSKKDE